MPTPTGSTVVGSAYITVGADTTKTGQQLSTALGAAGQSGGAALSKGITEGVSQSSAAMSKFAGTVNSSIGSTYAPILELGDKFEGLKESFTGEGASITSGLIGIGTAAVGVGASLMVIGSADKSANEQLQASITATGASYSDYQDEIEQTIKQQEKFGNSAVASQTALQSLITITGNVDQSVDLMGTTANLAAAKHMSLASAATQVGRAAEGNTRLFKMYGITVQTNADGTSDLAGALDQLNTKLQGQAAASVDSFTGRLKVLGTEVEDQVATFGQRWGPTITAAGVAIGAAGTLFQGASKAIDLLTKSSDAKTAATVDDTAATLAGTAAEEAGTATATKAALTEASLAKAEETASAAGQTATKSALELSAANDAVALSAGRAAEAEGAQGAASSGAGLAKIASGATLATVAIVGVTYAATKMFDQAKAQTAEGKAEFDSFWDAVSSNRNQQAIPDLTAEMSDLSQEIKDQTEALGHENIANGSHIEMLKELQTQYASVAASQKMITSNTSALSKEFGLSTAQVTALASANSIDLTKSYAGVEAAVQKLMGGTGDQLAQMKALETAYGMTADQVTAYAKANQITLTGLDTQTASFEVLASQLQQLEIQYGLSAAGVADFAKANNITLDGSAASTAAFQADEAQLVNLGHQYDQSTASVTAFAAANKIVLDGSTASNTAFSQAVATNKQVGSSTQIIDSALQTLGSDFSTVTDKANAYKSIMDTLIGTHIDESQALDNAQKAINDLGTALDKGTHSLSGTTDATISNRAAVEAIVQANIDAATAIYNQTGSITAANTAYDGYNSKLETAATKQGISKASLDTLLSSLQALPGQVSTTLAGAGAAGQGAGAAITQGVTEGATSSASLTKLQHGMATVASTAQTGLNALDAYGISAGQALAYGIATGMTSAAATAALDAAAESVANGTNGVVKHLEEQFQIQSPSKVTAKVGTQITAGIAQGMTDNTKAAADAATDLSKTISDELTSKTATLTGDLGILFKTQGTTIGQALTTGITTGTSPLDGILSTVGTSFTTQAQAISDQIKTIFDNAVSEAQAAQKSLAYDATTDTSGYGSSTVNGQPGASTTQAGFDNAYNVDLQFVKNLTAAKNKGISPSIIAQFQAAGPSAAAQLAELVSLSPTALADINSDQAKIGALGFSYGAGVGASALASGLGSTAIIGTGTTGLGGLSTAAGSTGGIAAAAKPSVDPVALMAALGQLNVLLTALDKHTVNNGISADKTTAAVVTNGGVEQRILVAVGAVQAQVKASDGQILTSLATELKAGKS